MKIFSKNKLTSTILTILSLLFSSGIVALILQNFFQSEVIVNASLIQPFPNPNDKGNIQALVVRNDGCKPAKKVIVKTTYPRIVQPLDYRIQSMENPEFETREDDELTFQINRLSKGDYIIVSFAVQNNEIDPSDIRIAHDDGVLESDYIEHIKLNKWRN